jgi:hypothetical protein
VADIVGEAGDKGCVAVFASGPSVARMAVEEVREVRRSCFTVFLNYAMARFGPEEMDALAFGDWKVSRWLADGNLKPTTALWATESAFQDGEPKSVMDEVGAWIVSSRGNFTLTNVLHDLRAFLPDRRVLLFGVDFRVEGETQKWYDAWTDEDRRGRAKAQDHSRCFEVQRRELALVDRRDVWNCTPGTALDVFEKAGDWRTVAERNGKT